MASNTKKLKVRRKLVAMKNGKARKNHIKLHGSTAKNLPLNMPNANEKAQTAAKAK